ncbi:MAG: hypothetical protein ACKO9Z_15205, partial [Planctomycetota bacterium]
KRGFLVSSKSPNGFPSCQSAVWMKVTAMRGGLPCAEGAAAFNRLPAPPFNQVSHGQGRDSEIFPMTGGRFGRDAAWSGHQHHKMIPLQKPKGPPAQPKAE